MELSATFLQQNILEWNNYSLWSNSSYNIAILIIAYTMFDCIIKRLYNTIKNKSYYKIIAFVKIFKVE